MPDYCKFFLTSVQKKMDNAVFDAIKSVVDDDFKGGLYTGTLENDGVGIADYQDVDSKVPQECRTRSTSTSQKIIDGSQSVEPTS